jgi:hypothetical protein
MEVTEKTINHTDEKSGKKTELRCGCNSASAWVQNSQVYKLPEKYSLAAYFRAGFLLILFFEPEDGGDMFFRNFHWLLMEYTAL